MGLLRTDRSPQKLPRGPLVAGYYCHGSQMSRVCPELTLAAPHAPRRRHCPMRQIYCFTDRHKHTDLACRQHVLSLCTGTPTSDDTSPPHGKRETPASASATRTAASLFVPEQLPSIYARICENPRITAPRRGEIESTAPRCLFVVPSSFLADLLNINSGGPRGFSERAHSLQFVTAQGRAPGF